MVINSAMSVEGPTMYLRLYVFKASSLLGVPRCSASMLEMTTATAIASPSHHPVVGLNVCAGSHEENMQHQ
jgi:hypothetical protein